MSRVSLKPRLAWGVVCLLLLSVVIGMWAYAQTLSNENAKLRAQIVTQKPAEATCKVTGDWKANTITLQSVATANGTREYNVHTPKNFAPDKYYPLLLFYPGKGATAQGVERSFGLDSLPAITVYPFPTTGPEGVTAWEGAPYSSDADDVGFTASILDKVQDELCIDRTHMYAAGFSNGGAFASLLSCELPGRFAAYAVVSGALYAPDGECQPSKPSPLINIHGDNDHVVPYTGSLVRRLPEIDSWLTMRAKVEQCSDPVITSPDATTIITTWSKCRGGGEVQNIRKVGGEHAWGQVPNPTLWQFLMRFSL